MTKINYENWNPWHGCTKHSDGCRFCYVYRQDRADFRLPIFAGLPIKHKSIVIAPMITAVDLKSYLNESIEEVTCSGESGIGVRPLNYDWVLDVRKQCVERNVPFQFHQTRAYFIKDGKTYRIPRKLQISQARRANIDFRIREMDVPESASAISYPEQLSLWDETE